MSVKASPEPGFFKALGGLWLLTWRAQLTSRRVLGGLVGLLAVPVLIYLATPSPEVWARHHGLPLGNPSVLLAGFKRRAARTGGSLTTQQQSDLTRILHEEFNRAETEWTQSGALEPSAERQYEVVEDCHNRVLQRVRPLLDNSQYAELQRYLQRQNRPPPGP